MRYHHEPVTQTDNMVRDCAWTTKESRVKLSLMIASSIVGVGQDSQREHPADVRSTKGLDSALQYSYSAIFSSATHLP
jgi:hypothetical protein